MSRMLAIWEPRWKCSSCRQSSLPRLRRRSTSARIWEAERPNLDMEPPLDSHMPEPVDARRARTPMLGLMLRRADSSSTISSSEGFSTTM
jgi:hypothetical protein